MPTTLTCEIETRDDALTIIKDATYCFLWLAGLLLVLAVPVDYRILGDVIVLTVSVSCLRRFHSRTAAVILLAQTSLVEVGIFAHSNDGILISLGAVSIWLAVRSVEASFKLHGRFASPGLEQAA